MKGLVRDAILFLGGAAIGAVGKDIYENNVKPAKAPKQQSKTTTSKVPAKKTTKKVK